MRIMVCRTTTPLLGLLAGLALLGCSSEEGAQREAGKGGSTLDAAHAAADTALERIDPETVAGILETEDDAPTVGGEPEDKGPSAGGNAGGSPTPGSQVKDVRAESARTPPAPYARGAEEEGSAGGGETAVSDARPEGWFANRVIEAPMGDPRFKEMPPRKDDPEWESLITGKREVAVHELEFEGGEDSPEALARKIVAFVDIDSREGLRSLAVTREEFEKILWPEFPASRPVTNWKDYQAWGIHAAKVESGISEGLEHRNKGLTFDSVTCEGGRMPYTNFTLYDDIHIHAHTVAGESVTLEFAQAFVERKGKWKVQIYDD
ncbi:MAG: hypothetical protein GF355_02930 [Candidatus Eisenbacteria bacterium]|nr:hypothetical protein [Candidatus Eisenbacteria bacterium]